jgi:hypothetical protein
MGAESKEVSGILDELISTIPNADVHVVFTELEEGGLKASLRSSPAIDANRLAAQLFGGGGHPRAAGFRIPRFQNFALQVLECVQKLKEGMVRQREEVQGERPMGDAKRPPVPLPPPAAMKKEEGMKKRGKPVPPSPKAKRTAPLDVVSELQSSSQGPLERASPPSEKGEDVDSESGK